MRVEPVDRPDLELVAAPREEVVLFARAREVLPLLARLFGRAELLVLFFAREVLPDALLARDELLAEADRLRAELARLEALLPLLEAFFARELPLLEAFFAREVPLLEALLARAEVLLAALRAREDVPLLARRVPLALFAPEPLEPDRARLPDERLLRAAGRAAELREPPPSSCSSSWLISFLATLTAAGTATPNAAPATTFFVVDIPSSSGSISQTSHVVGSCLSRRVPR